MSSVIEKPRWEGKIEDLLLCYFLFPEFKLSNYLLSKDQLKAFDELLWQTNQRDYPGGI